MTLKQSWLAKPYKPLKAKSVKQGHRQTNYSKTEVFHSRFQNSYTRSGRFPLSEVAFADDYVSSTKSRNFGSDVQDFRRKIDRCENATTTADCRDISWVAAGYFNWFWANTQLTGDPQFPSQEQTVNLTGNYRDAAPNASLSLPTGLEDQAKSLFISKARKAQSSMMGGEFVHDIGKSLQSFNKIRHFFLLSLSDRVDLMKKVRRQFLGQKNESGAVKALSNTWLEWYYGIKPTIADLQDAGFGIGRAYLRTRNNWGDRQHIRAGALAYEMSTTEFNLGPPSSNAPGYLRVHCTVSEVKEYLVILSGGVLLKTDESFIHNVGQELGTGLNSFIPTLWEIIPYSFVVDYFTNIGQIISASVFPRSDVLWMNKVIRNTVSRSIQYSPKYTRTPDGVVTASVFTQSPDTLKSKAYSRQIFSGSLVPSFRWHLPFRESAWSGILALIGQKIA